RNRRQLSDRSRRRRVVVRSGPAISGPASARPSVGGRSPLVMSLEPLPIDSHLADIVQLVQRSRALVVTAQPGAGKTTRVPPALVDAGPLILLQPRRVAARAIARRIAEE